MEGNLSQEMVDDRKVGCASCRVKDGGINPRVSTSGRTHSRLFVLEGCPLYYQLLDHHLRPHPLFPIPCILSPSLVNTWNYCFQDPKSILYSR